MKKQNWAIAASIHVMIRIFRKSGQKTRRWRQMLLVCAWAGGLWSFPGWSFAASPDHCVILVRTIGNDLNCYLPGNGGYAGFHLYEISGYNFNYAESLEKRRVGTWLGCWYPSTIYHVSYYKWFWNGDRWSRDYSEKVPYSLGIIDVGLNYTPLPPVPGEIVSHDYVDILKLYPNGCPGLPSQQPDNTPNPDSGKPDCPQLPLN